MRAHVRARERKLPLIVGAQVSVGGEAEPLSTIVLLAQDRQGYANLCRLLTAGRRRCPKGESRVTWDEVGAHADSLLALWGGDASLLVQDRDPDDVAGILRDAFSDRLYAVAARHRRDTEVEEDGCGRVPPATSCPSPRPSKSCITTRRAGRCRT